MGEEIRKATEVENGTFDLIKPTNNGIVEHEQKGVTAPTRAPQAAESSLFFPAY